MSKDMSHVRVELNFLLYLHERAQELRNKETQACLMFLAGSTLFIGGVLEALSLTEDPEWFIFIPYYITPIAGSVMSLTLIIGGLSLMIFGLASALRYRMIRTQYMEQLHTLSSKKWDELKKTRQVKESVPRPKKRKKKPQTEWWVYENWASKPSRARVHKTTCLYCKPQGRNAAKTTEEPKMKWWGPYDTWKKAWKKAEQLKRNDTAFCSRCCKKLSKMEQKGQLEFLLTPPPKIRG